MATRDLRSYFQLKSKAPTNTTPDLLRVSQNITPADADAASKVVKAVTSVKERGKYASNIPPRVKVEVAKYALSNGTKAALKRFSSKYPQYEFKRVTINNWKKKIPKDQESGEGNFINKIGRPNKVNDEIMLKIKEIIVGIRLAGAAISQKMVIAIGRRVIKANNPSLLLEFEGSVTLTENWARGVLKNMNWVKRKGTTGKVEPSKQLLAEEKLTFQKNISKVVYEHDIPSELIINLDQTPLSYVSPGKQTFNSKDAKNLPVKGIDNKRQITATFAVSAEGDFLPMQLIYAGETKRCLPKFDFPKNFNVTFTKNHCQTWRKL